MSTDKTKARTSKVARRIATGVNREKKAADHEYQRNYIKEHSEG